MRSSEGTSSLGRLSSAEPSRAKAMNEAQSFGRPSPGARRPAPKDATLLLAAKLRAKLGDGAGVLALTSLRGREAVSSAVAELGEALTAGKGDDPVLIVDANLSSPSQHQAFGLSPSPGLSELLSGETDVSDAVRATTSPKLFVLPAGRILERGVQGVDRARFREVLAVLRSHFHTILVDAPPLAERGALALLPGHSDGVLMLIAPGRHDRSQVRKALSELESLGVNVIGTCLSTVETPEREGLLPRLAGRARGWLRSREG